jgi:hypothetical protein
MDEEDCRFLYVKIKPKRMEHMKERFLSSDNLNGPGFDTCSGQDAVTILKFEKCRNIHLKHGSGKSM